MTSLPAPRGRPPRGAAYGGHATTGRPPRGRHYGHATTGHAAAGPHPTTMCLPGPPLPATTVADDPAAAGLGRREAALGRVTCTTGRAGRIAGNAGATPGWRNEHPPVLRTHDARGHASTRSSSPVWHVLLGPVTAVQPRPGCTRRLPWAIPPPARTSPGGQVFVWSQAEAGTAARLDDLCGRPAAYAMRRIWAAGSRRCSPGIRSRAPPAGGKAALLAAWP